MAGGTWIKGQQRTSSSESPTAGLEAKFDEFLNYMRGDDITGGVSGSPIQLGRKALKDVQGAMATSKEELPDLFQSLGNKIATGRMSREEASNAFEMASRAVGGKNTYKRADKLAGMTQGVAPASKYDPYRSFMNVSTEQMLGRQLSDPEFKNYVSAFQGMGITNPADVAASFGKMLTTSDEYKNRQFRFTPKNAGMTVDYGGNTAMASAQAANAALGY